MRIAEPSSADTRNQPAQRMPPGPAREGSHATQLGAIVAGSQHMAKLADAAALIRNSPRVATQAKMAALLNSGHRSTAQRFAAKAAPWQIPASGNFNHGAVAQLASLDVTVARASANQQYAILNDNASDLYAHRKAAKPRPVTRFSGQETGYDNYPFKYRSSDNPKKQLEYDSDCGQYARSLIAQGHKGTVNYKLNLIGSAAEPKIGNAYYISPVDSPTNASAAVAGVAAPWDLSQNVAKGATNFHVATVVAKDGSDNVITSEVNAAFPARKAPWFGMYGTGAAATSFFNTFSAEYQSAPGGVATPPRVFSYGL